MYTQVCASDPTYVHSLIHLAMVALSFLLFVSLPSAALQQEIAKLKAAKGKDEDGIDARIQFLVHQVCEYRCQ